MSGVIGETIKDFKIVALLGKGGMGEVYLAEQPIVQTKVAIKLLREEISRDEQHVQRFFNEAIAASRVKHAAIVKIFDVGFHGKRAYLIMEHLDGDSLATRIRRAPRGLPTEEVADLGAQIAGVLGACHEVGITHRDLKPDNVFVVPDAELARRERVKLLDFGIAKLAIAPGDAGLDATTPHTATNSSMGTPAYMAPEQWNDAARADGRADVYSLGCVLFEMAAGRPPFVAASMGEACTKHLTATPPRLRTVVAGAPVALEELIADMLEKAPETRPTMQAVGAALGGMRTGVTSPEATAPTIAPVAPTSTAATAASTARAARPLWIVPATVGVVALAVVALVAITRGDGAGRAESSGAASGAAAPPSPTTPAAGGATSAGCPDGMVRAAGGTFWMGSDAYDDEGPPHEMTVAAFCIDRTEVTVAAYADCVAKGACTAAAREVNVAGWSAEKVALWSRFCNAGREDRRAHPINCVDWDQASAYCAFAGKRLPTEAEWEWAARGSDGRRFPWGNDAPTARRANVCGGECRALGRRLGQDWNVMFDEEDGWESTAPAGSFPDGASAIGAHDLAGNVAEWVSDGYGPYGKDAEPATRVVRDSGWGQFQARFIRTTARSWGPPNLHSDNVGFRCVR